MGSFGMNLLAVLADMILLSSDLSIDSLIFDIDLFPHLQTHCADGMFGFKLGVEFSFTIASFTFPLVAANLGHASLYPNGLATPLAALDSIWTPPSTFVSITPPSICQTQGSANGCVSNSVVARRVTYQDCGDPWVLCACNGTGAITLVFRLHSARYENNHNN